MRLATKHLQEAADDDSGTARMRLGGGEEDNAEPLLRWAVMLHSAGRNLHHMGI